MLLMERFFILAALGACVVAASGVNQIHIAQGVTPESMIISWQTESPSAADCRYGLSEIELSNAVSSDDIVSYSYDYYEYAPYQSGTFHHVMLTDLKADQEYFYQCGDFATTDVVSEVNSFVTMPPVGDTRRFKLAVLGDLGTTSDSLSTVRHVQRSHAGMLLHVGDLSYGDCQQVVWDEYGNMMEPLAKNIPWMVGPGNHEVEANWGDNGTVLKNQFFLAYESRYRMPAVKPPTYGAITIPGSTSSTTGNPYCASSQFQMEYDYGNAYYSFDTASVHVVSLNCYSTSNASSTQYKWLEGDLQQVDRSITPWVVVMMHCPWYNTNTAHNGEQQQIEMQEAMEPLFYKYHVNVAFEGHVHAYERTYPVYMDETTADGTVYVTIGDAGNREGHAGEYSQPTPEWSAFRNGTQYGHGILDVINNTHSEWQWHRNVDGEIVHKDSYMLCNSAVPGAC